MRTHLLPFALAWVGDDEQKEEILNLGLLPHEVEYMRTHQTLELPENFFRLHREKSPRRRIEFLEFTAFNLRPTFPHNIVLMKTGQVVYATRFETKGGKTAIFGHSLLNVSL
jgi:hypothetical protein